MLEKFARYPLTFGPTPIEKLQRLSAHLGGLEAAQGHTAAGSTRISAVNALIEPWSHGRHFMRCPDRRLHSCGGAARRDV
jgi:hypothetical protein